MKKRVWALYRVSTDRQVTEEDIPMQRKAVHQFMQSKSNWVLEKELSELGVSGYKKSVSERDKIQLIKKGAENKEYDILLVWKDDRLGRNKFEIPFMLEYLKKNGIEVWSVVDGVLNKDERHEDSLVSFLRFWVAEGESKKTSTRVTEAIKQMNEEGKWTGARVPYGYEVYDTNQKHPKHEKTMKNIRINEEQSRIVKLMFLLVLEKGYGADRITNYLNECGIPSQSGVKWRNNVVRRILRNPIYKGEQRYGTTYSNNKLKPVEKIKLKPKRDDLVIISDEIFDEVQNIIDSRKIQKDESEYKVVAPSKYLLLNGLAKCGYCGSRLFVDSSTKTKIKKNGEKSSYTYWRYICREGTNHRETHPKCYFGAKKYDYETEEVIIETMKLIELNGLEEAVNESKKLKIENELIVRKNIIKEIDETKKQLEALKKLIIKIAMGESKLSEEYVEEQINNKEEELKEYQRRLDECNEKIADLENENKKTIKIKSELCNWEEKYRNADWDSKKTMLSKVLDSVEYGDVIKINFNIIINELLKQSM
ncbi:recombinase family protein [Brevibacillus laterosporus]|uniref:Recombinase family protein n=1 Tax=Brevibacillus laterosporus TaxID=1465 RepID=A0A518VC72_BRELA|nr:recombinase family protein [Brevibacillus laterosporus]